MQPSYAFLAGIDWGGAAHQVCILDLQRPTPQQHTIEHSATALAKFLDGLTELCGGELSLVAVAIETPRGAVVEALLERGFTVFSLNPKQLDRFRDRYFPAGCKDDRRDAFVLADSLRTDQHCFRQVRADDPKVIRMREMSRLDDDLSLGFHRHSAQLRDLLQRYYPQALTLCPAADEPWLWALLQLAPSPSQGAKLSASRLRQLLRQHRIRRFSGDELQAALRAAQLALLPGTVPAVAEHVLLLLPHLRLWHSQRHELRERIEALLQEMTCQEEQVGQHRDLAIILSLPGIGNVVAATMLAEAAPALAEREYHALRAYAGLAPVTRRSGQKKLVLMRRGCNPRLRNACYHWSRIAMQRDPRSRQHYDRLRGSGHSHGRALRGVADRLLAMLCAMLRAQTFYDPARRSARVQTQVA